MTCRTLYGGVDIKKCCEMSRFVKGEKVYGDTDATSCDDIHMNNDEKVYGDTDATICDDSHMNNDEKVYGDTDATSCDDSHMRVGKRRENIATLNTITAQ